MPEMSGYDVLEQLQSDSRTSGIKVVVNTSMRLAASDLKRLQGAAGIIAKEHLGREDALAAVREVLDHNGLLVQ